MGGVSTDLEGRTSLPGLFAAGEVACTGLHGANRLASNSLLEGLVFGARSGAAMARWRAGDRWPEAAPAVSDPMVPVRPDPGPELTEDDVRDLMWTSAGIFRDRDRLEQATSRLEPAYLRLIERHRDPQTLDPSAWRLLSLVTVGRLIARAALRREESRGPFYREDFPFTDNDNWLVKNIVAAGAQGMEFRTEPYETPFLKPEFGKRDYFAVDW
jgi:L-aspartate oxidase